MMLVDENMYMSIDRHRLLLTHGSCCVNHPVMEEM